MRLLTPVSLIALAGLGLAADFKPGSIPRQFDPSTLTGALGGLGVRGEPLDDLEVKGAGRRRRQEGEGARHGPNHCLGTASRKGLGRGKDSRAHKVCLKDKDVEELVDAYVRMLSHWDDADAKYLSDTFVDRSDSINILAGLPLGGPTFPNREAFIEHQHTQPDNLPLVVTHASPTSCTEIALIWQATFGAAQKQVRGVTILGAVRGSGAAPGAAGVTWQIDSIDVEFNNLAYLLDIGGSYKMPGQP